MSIKLTADLKPRFENGHGDSLAVLKGTVTNVNATCHLAHSNIGYICFINSKFCKTLQFSVKNVLIYDLNKLTEEGFKIPSIHGILLVNPKLKFKDKYTILTTDITV